jgi:hypothetical protein
MMMTLRKQYGDDGRLHAAVDDMSETDQQTKAVALAPTRIAFGVAADVADAVDAAGFAVVARDTRATQIVTATWIETATANVTAK